MVQGGQQGYLEVIHRVEQGLQGQLELTEGLEEPQGQLELTEGLEELQGQLELTEEHEKLQGQLELTEGLEGTTGLVRASSRTRRDHRVSWS